MSLELNNQENVNGNVDESKLNRIKYQLLEMENENVVKKESNTAMVEKIKKMIIREVDKR